MIELR